MSQTPPTPPFGTPPPPYGPNPYAGQGFPPQYPDARTQRRILRDQAKAQSYHFKQQARAQRDFYRMQSRRLTRRSILGPILLISVGVVALLLSTGRLPLPFFAGWYGRWWPLLIVLAGLVMLGEWAWDQYAPEDPAAPRIRRRAGAGVIFLLLFVAALGEAAHLSQGHEDFLVHGLSINPDNVDQLFGERHESEETIDRAFAAGNTLSIDNPRGDVTIVGRSDDNQLHIIVNKQVYAFIDSDAESRAESFVPKVDFADGRMSVSMPSLQSGSADLMVTVPDFAQVTVNATHGDVHLSNLKAPVSLTAGRGDVELHDIAASVSAHVNHTGSSFSAHDIQGDVSVRGQGNDITLRQITGSAALEGDFYGDTHVEHIGGPFTFHTSRTTFSVARVDGQIDMSPHEDLTAESITGPTNLSTRSRTIHFNHLAGDVNVTNSNGDVDISRDTPTGDVTITNRNGAANVTLPKASGFALTAESEGGEISNDFGLPILSENSHNSLTGKVGNGAGKVMINTRHGDISIRQNSEVPLPPPPPPAPSAPPAPIKSVGPLKSAKPARTPKLPVPPTSPVTGTTIQF